jgi:phospholipid/cholesterol/gamma-HCH transport system substrate-binding protein
LHRAYLGITNNEQKLAETFDALHRTLRGTANFLEHSEPKLDKILDNVEGLSSEARETLAAARQRYVDGAQVTRILNDVERSSNAVSQNIGPLLTDSRDFLARGKKLTDALASDEQLAQYRALTRDLGEAAGQAKRLARDAQSVVSHIQQGKGTVGALVMEDALYDDVQELLRDLKHNPWKLFWRQ